MNANVADIPHQRYSTAFRPSMGVRLAALAIFVYTVYAIGQLDFSWARAVTGMDNGAHFLSRMFPPDLTKGDVLWKGIAESLQIAVLASAGGIVLSLPIGLLGARNLMPAWATWFSRGLVVLCRSLHPVIVSILFVKAVGFGALAGILALIVYSIGFIGKLFAEAIGRFHPSKWRRYEPPALRS